MTRVPKRVLVNHIHRAPTPVLKGLAIPPHTNVLLGEAIWANDRGTGIVHGAHVTVRRRERGRNGGKGPQA